MAKEVRTRYAPSPTGYFHIGGARSALFNYLFAKHYHGKFILRIEDTDINRNVDKGIESQYENLVWLGLIPDESMFNPNKAFEPYIQSKKFDLYKTIADELLEKGLVYRCFCSTQELQEAREESLKNHQTPKYNRHCLHLSNDEIQQNLKNKKPYVLRLKIKDNHDYCWNDMIRGKICIPSSALTDYVILRENNIPSYNFANPIDDHDMKISHIIRGEEHISNTPYQLATIDALKQLDRYQDSKEDFDFIYAHLPVVNNPNGKKLSKRDTSLKQFIGDYKEMGFLPMAINNFLVLLGWSDKNNQEYFSNLNELIKEFDGTRISKSPGIFDFVKMLSVNKKHLDALSDEQYLKEVKKFLKINLHDFHLNENETLLLFRKDLRYFSEINDLIDELLHPKKLELDDETKAIYENAMNHDLKEHAILLLNNIKDWSISELNNWLKELSMQTQLKGKNLYLPLRIGLFGALHGPEFIKLVHIFGKEYCLKKLNAFNEIIRK